MCIGDWRAGRLIRSVHTKITLGAGGSQVIRENRQRVGITIGVDNEATLAGVAVTQLLIDATFLMNFDESVCPLHFCMLWHGELPTKKFTITDLGAGTQLGIIEYFMPEEMLSEALENFKRDYKSQVAPPSVQGNPLRGFTS